MPPRRSNRRRHTNPNNNHPYANPADEFNLSFGAAAADQQAQQAPGGDDDNRDNDDGNRGDDESSTSDPTNNNSNTTDPGRRFAHFRENVNP